MRRRLAWLGLLLAVLGGAATGAQSDGGHGRITALAAAPPQAPNIVFVLADDLSWNLVDAAYMPNVVALEQRGTTFDHYVVADSLCCPSRASIFTGLFPHDSRVFSNTGPMGGYSSFIRHRPNLETRTFAVALQARGYRTAMMGKYLNGYGEPVMTRHVPAGWDDWHVAGFGYPEFGYDLNENGRIVHYGAGPPPPANARNYLTDVLAARAVAFIGGAAEAGKPFMLEVAPFAPHYPYTPAPRNAHDFPGLAEPRDPSFNAANVNSPDWLTHGARRRLSRAEVQRIDRDFRRRVQADEAIDSLVGRIEQTLDARGLTRNTYIVFSSDNGYHMGQHRLLPGKQTAFDTDIRVPLIISGPGAAAHNVVSRVAQNVDLYPTFLQLAGIRPAASVDGHSLVTLLHRALSPSAWRTAALIEHHGPRDRNDPDFENGERSGDPPSYEAIRLADRRFGNAVYVEYTQSGQREYYNIDADPFERRNIYGTLSRSRRAQLHAVLSRLANCHGANGCWTAGLTTP